MECFTEFKVQEIIETVEEISFNKKRKIQTKKEKIYHEVIGVIHEIRAVWSSKGKPLDIKLIGMKVL